MVADSGEGRGRCSEFSGGRYKGRVCGYSDGVGRAGVSDAEGMAVERGGAVVNPQAVLVAKCELRNKRVMEEVARP